MARTKSLVRPHLENWARFKDHISGKTVNNKERSRREYCGGYEGSSWCRQLLQSHWLLQMKLGLL